jgi:hypothetical protein
LRAGGGHFHETGEKGNPKGSPLPIIESFTAGAVTDCQKYRWRDKRPMAWPTESGGPPGSGRPLIQDEWTSLDDEVAKPRPDQVHEFFGRGKLLDVAARDDDDPDSFDQGRRGMVVRPGQCPRVTRDPVPCDQDADIQGPPLDLGNEDLKLVTPDGSARRLALDRDPRVERDESLRVPVVPDDEVQFLGAKDARRVPPDLRDAGDLREQVGDQVFEDLALLVIRGGRVCLLEVRADRPAGVGRHPNPSRGRSRFAPFGAVLPAQPP